MYPSALDGKDARILRNDWRLLELDDLSKPSSEIVYSSKHFAAVAAALGDLPNGGGADALEELPELARSTLHFARAMHALRKSPKELPVLFRRFGCMELFCARFRKP